MKFCAAYLSPNISNGHVLLYVEVYHCELLMKKNLKSNLMIVMISINCANNISNPRKLKSIGPKTNINV